VTTNEYVALKLEDTDIQPSLLELEVEHYQELEGVPGFPQIYLDGGQDEMRVMAFELLGPSLEDLFLYCGRRFSLKTVLMIADQLLGRLFDLHNAGIVHRDIKPSNLLLGNGANNWMIYMVDLGCASWFRYAGDDFDPLQDDDGFLRLLGTPTFASVQGHTGHGTVCLKTLMIVLR